MVTWNIMALENKMYIVGRELFKSRQTKPV